LLSSQAPWTRASAPADGQALCARASRFHSRNAKPRLNTFLLTESRQLYADLSDQEHAFEWLNTAYQERDAGLMNLRTDFTMDSMRSDPRYAELVRKIGFPQ